MYYPSLPNNKFPPKTGDYCRTEIELMVKILLENRDLFKSSQDEVFEKMANALEGKRTQRNIKDWFLNTQKILETQDRWTKIIKDSIPDEQKVQLKEVFLSKGIQFNHQPSAPPLYQETVEELIYEPTEEKVIRLFQLLDEEKQTSVRIALMNISSSKLCATSV